MTSLYSADKLVGCSGALYKINKALLLKLLSRKHFVHFRTIVIFKPILKSLCHPSFIVGSSYDEKLIFI